MIHHLVKYKWKGLTLCFIFLTIKYFMIENVILTGFSLTSASVTVCDKVWLEKQVCILEDIWLSTNIEIAFKVLSSSPPTPFFNQ